MADHATTSLQEVLATTADPIAGGFGNQTLPYGIVRPSGGAARVAVAVGDAAIDLTVLLESQAEFAQPSLNAFMAQGRERWQHVRRVVQDRVERGVRPQDPDVHVLSEVDVLLPFEVADFVDFFSGIEHASNVGRILRPDDADPLKPNYRHLPAGYHGRAGTVVPSGTEVNRPTGQVPTADGPVVQPSDRLDIEVELGYVVGVPSTLGVPVSGHALRDHVFGVVILIDWSARDIQAWEYQPLGPFLAKSFATTISPWVAPLEALDWVEGPRQEPAVLPYLEVAEPRNPAISFEVELNGTIISRPKSGGLYWSPAQQLAHMTSNGASLRTGDLYGTGTISSLGAAGMGSLMELSLGGTRSFALDDGTTRTFLQDGDEVIVRASVTGDPARTLGQTRTLIAPGRG
ncbi:fumarylacetoacetate hydrolase family protein [Nocardioides sp. NPDC127503]|uniref:fumarylacetoacetate hydrolase family protein n=1 Tax=Nocardioides sp. NPDC127503 TaxID=3154516 RepID=UPI003330FD68